MHSERVSNIIAFINEYIWEGTNCSPKINDLKRFEKNNPTIALNILFTNEKQILQAYISIHNSNREKQIFLLMIPNKKTGKITLFCRKKVLLRGITSKYHSDFFCLNCLNSFRTENKLKSH